MKKFDIYVKQADEFWENQEFKEAAICYEEARRSDLSRESELFEILARTYLRCGDSIRAIYWFECAAEEFGMDDYRQDLMELYQTGVVGKELKDKADQYFEDLKKTEEEREREKRRAAILKDITHEKAEYPEKLVAKMKKLIEFERTYVYKLRDFDRDERGADGETLKKIKRDRQNLNKRYEELLDECRKEKVNCNVRQDFFFEYPLLKGPRGRVVDSFRKDGGYSLYWANEEKPKSFYMKEQGYDIIYNSSLHAKEFRGLDLDHIYYNHNHWDTGRDMDVERYVHVPATKIGGELEFSFLDEKNGTQCIKDVQQDVSNAKLCLSRDFYRKPLIAGIEYFKRFLINNKSIILYCDWEYLKEHLEENMEESYEIAYLWDSDILYVENYDDNLAPLVSLDHYCLASKVLTEIGLPVGEKRYFKDMKEYIMKWGPNYTYECKEEYCADYRFMKKASIIMHGEKIIAILLPKESSEVIKVHAGSLQIVDGKYTEYKRKVSSIRLEPGANWEYFVATTMDALAFQFKDKLPVFDITEQKPEGLPADLWRLWVRFRYASNADNK